MIRILLQSEDRYFIQAFSNYASTHCANMEFVCFSTQDKALEYAVQTTLRFDAVLAPAALLAQIPWPHATRLLIGEHTSFSSPEQMTINIYQSGPAILADIKNALILSGNHMFGDGNHSAHVVAVYSVQGGSGKTTISYALAAAAARSGKQALYVNLEPFPACGQLYEHEFARSMDDVLFALKSGRELAPILLDTMERNDDHVAVLPPFSQAGDMLSMTQENCKDLIEVLAAKTNMDYIFLDLPTGFQPMNLWILENCSLVLLVYTDSACGREHRARAEKDLYFKNLPIHGGILTIFNACQKKTPEEGISGKLPFSESLLQGRRVGDVLDRNPAYLKSCQEILQRIDSNGLDL